MGRFGAHRLPVQGVIYTVIGITETELKLQMHPEYCTRGAGDETALVRLDEACSQLRLCHSMCYYTCQGRTVRDRHMVLIDVRHPHFTVRALIVGLSHVGDDNSEALFGGERVVRQRGVLRS